MWANNSEQQSAWNLWKEEVSVSEHDNAALAVDCLDPGQLYVTAGADGNVKVNIYSDSFIHIDGIYF